MRTRLVAWRRGTCARHSTFPALAPVLALALALAAALPLGFAASASATSSSAAAWGENGSGELGNATTTRSLEPSPVAGLSGVTAVAAGGEHSLALLADGTVMAWGNNRSGQLGNGSTASSDTPVLVSGLGGVRAIAAGRQYSLALLTNGTVMAWGSNEDGQLGVGSAKPVTSTKPVAVKGITSATAIAAGASFAVARLADGTVVSWGAGDEGQLGNGKMAKSTTPVMVAGLSGVTAVAAGEEHALALLANGTVESWGSNFALQLGMEPKTKIVEEEVEVLEEPENSDVPVAVQALSGVTAIAAGARHSLALLGSGEVMAWGSNAADQLGNGATGQPSGMPSPVHGLGGVSAIAAGANHSFALLSGGTVLGWGYNAAGQLGDGAYTNSPVPVAVTGLSGVAGIAGGAFHSVSFGAPVAGISGVSPASGSVRGATSVTITGSNLSEAIAVRFGANPASTFTVNSPTSITAASPAGAGVVNVTVTTPFSTSAKNAADSFTYVAPPRITGVSPKTGPTAGGTSVTIKGASFGDATSVSFGGASSTSFTVNSPSSITAVSPPAPSGKVAISVTTPFGTSESVLADTFKYAAPTITSLSPSSGPHQGGTVVTVLGTGFSPAVGTTAFKFGAAQATSVSCESMTRCTFTTPARKPGVYDVAAVVGGLKSTASPPGDQFTFQ